MARKNRFGTFMNINILYWIIGLVVIYFFCIKKKSEFGSEWDNEEFSRIKSKVESACKSIGGTYIEKPQSGTDMGVVLGYCQKEIDLKSSFGETRWQKNRRIEEEEKQKRKEKQMEKQRQQKEAEDKIINAKKKELSKIRAQLLSACQSTKTNKNFNAIKQSPWDHNKIDLGYCDVKYIY
jgi:hypothetical protein